MALLMAAVPAVAQDRAAILYVRGEDGTFARSVALAVAAPIQTGEEVQAGPSTYRVLRVRHLLVEGRIAETRIYVERTGPAEAG